MTQKFIDENPNTAVAITKALIRAGKWLDDPKIVRQRLGYFPSQIMLAPIRL